MPASLGPRILSHTLRRNRTRVLKWFGRRRDTPWMRPYEEDLLRELLSALRPLRCLEWGGGLSTLQFPALLPAAATWLTIEHDAAWAAQLATRVTRPGVRVQQVPPDDPSFSGDGDASSFRSYLAAADAAAPYDFIFIDGRARAACLERAARLLADDGVVVLHDANRDAYLGPTRQFPQQALFRDARARRPARVSGGVWIGSRSRDLASCLDLDLHRRLFSFYSGVGRLLA